MAEINKIEVNCDGVKGDAIFVKPKGMKEHEFYCQLCKERFPDPDFYESLRKVREHLFLEHNVPYDKHMTFRAR